MRNVVGGLLAVLGAAVTLISPWQAWYNGRHGSTYKFWEVFGSGVTGSQSGVTDSVFLVFLITAVATVVGLLMRSRTLVLVAGVVAFGFTILWMVRQGQAAGELVVSSGSRGLGGGVGYALAGGLLMIIGGLVMTGQPRRAVVADRADRADRAGRGDRTDGRVATAGAAGAAGAATAARAPESNAIPTNPPNPSAPARPVQPPPRGATAASAEQAEQAGQAGQVERPVAGTPSERTGTERLSKEERQLLGLDEDAPTQTRPKQD